MILESPLDWREIKPVNPKGNQPWIIIGKTDAEALIFWSPYGATKCQTPLSDWKQPQNMYLYSKFFSHLGFTDY